eukprot:scaffold3715_cov249-Ochromonas_danica.AAC.2
MKKRDGGIVRNSNELDDKRREKMKRFYVTKISSASSSRVSQTNSVVPPPVKSLPSSSLEVIDLILDDNEEEEEKESVVVLLDDNNDDDEDDEEEEEAIMRCVVCEDHLVGLSAQQQEEHIRHCLDRFTPASSSSHTPPDQSNTDSINTTTTTNTTTNTSSSCPSDYGLRGKLFYCVVCDLDLSGRRLLSRCWHLKRCGREHALSTRQLLRLLAPTREEQMNEEKADDDDDDGHEAIDIPTSTTVSTEPRNALAMLMQASKQQSQLRGMFPSSTTNGTTINRSKSTGTLLDHTTNSSSSSSKRPTKDEGKVSGGGGGKRSRSMGWSASLSSSGGSATGSSHAPAYKKIQMGNMTHPIVVDGFQYAHTLLSDCYFLTHFHSDHTQGLTAKFNSGKIYCSAVTAALVKLRLGVSSAHLVALSLETKYVIAVGGQDIEVTLIDANHCPGSKMLASSPSLRHLLTSSSSTRIHNALTVYLDTTYCDASYAFPPQDEVIHNLLQLLLQEIDREHTLFLFGAYTIGKERVFMTIAKAFGQRIFVDKTRWKTMLCYDWPMEEMTLLTTDCNVTNLWVVGMHQLSFNAMPALLAKKQGCRRVVAIQPTGWTHSKGSRGKVRGGESAQGDGGITIRRKGSNVIYAAPYSEHSSFKELVRFIQVFR